eukprot:jgi/Tetstr1/436547/TSEL_002702.t1
MYAPAQAARTLPTAVQSQRGQARQPGMPIMAGFLRRGALPLLGPCRPLLHGAGRRSALAPSFSFSPPLRAAASAAAGDKSAAAQGQALVDWIEASGGSVSGVALRSAGETGWCLSAAAGAEPGTALIRLPEECHLTYDDSSDPATLELLQRIPPELWGARLAVQLLSQRARTDTSEFSPYIGLLPKAVEGVPMFFPGSAIKALQYPTLIAQVTKRCRFLVDFAGKDLAEVVGTERDPFGGQIVDANALGWALAVVTSRAFRTKGPDHPAAMLPLIDMCNHSFKPNCEIRPVRGGAVELVATQELWPSQELLLNYGPLGNDLLLLDYGFLVDDNPHDTCQLRFDVPLLEAGRAAGSADKNAEPDFGAGPKEWQKQALSELDLLDGRNAMVFIGGPPSQPVDKRLLAAARVLCAAGPEDLRAMRAEAQRLGVSEAMGSLRQPLGDAAREAEALRMVIGVAALVLGQFPTTVQEDLAVLAAGKADGKELTAEMRLAVRFRTEMKKGLLRSVNSLSVRLKELPATGGGNGTAPSAAPGSGKKASKAERAKAKHAKRME